MLSDERSPPMGTGKGIQQLALILLFAAILAGCASSNNAGGMSGIDQMIPGATKWGHYNGEPVANWTPDGRTMTLLTELRYTDPHGEVWVAPVGSVVDGASMPRYLWSAVAGLRPDVLLRHALQRGWRDRIQDHVLRSLQVRASLEVSHQARQTGEI